MFGERAQVPCFGTHESPLSLLLQIVSHPSENSACGEEGSEPIPMEAKFVQEYRCVELHVGEQGPSRLEFLQNLLGDGFSFLGLS